MCIIACLFFGVGVSLLSSNSYSSLNYTLSTLEAGTHSVLFASNSVRRRQWEYLSLFVPLVLLFQGNTVSTAPEEGTVTWSHDLAPGYLSPRVS